MIRGGGPEEIEKKEISKALLQEKINLKRPSPGKNKSHKAFSKKNKSQKALLREK